MSRSCELTGVKAISGRYVPVNRSQTGVRTLRKFSPNIQRVSVASDALGKVTLRLAVRTIRSIEHNGGLDKFLINTSSTKLTDAGKKLKKQITAKTAPEAVEKPVRRQDVKSPKSLAAAKKREAAGEKAPAKKAAAKKAPAKAAKKAAE